MQWAPQHITASSGPDQAASVQLHRSRREGHTSSQAEISVLSKGRFTGDACEANAMGIQRATLTTGRATASPPARRA